MFDLTPLLQALIGLAAAAITAYVIPYIKSRTGVERLERMRAWAEIGVKAAEQIYPGPGRGEEKKAYVLAFLREYGLAVDAVELNAFLESAVKDLQNEEARLTETED